MGKESAGDVDAGGRPLLVGLNEQGAAMTLGKVNDIYQLIQQRRCVRKGEKQ